MGEDMDVFVSCVRVFMCACASMLVCMCTRVCVCVHVDQSTGTPLADGSRRVGNTNSVTHPHMGCC